MNNPCPNNPRGSQHTLAGDYATVSTKAEFEPVEYGKTAEDTRYKRVEYVTSVCSCGYSQKKRLQYIYE
jgi:hypothetical protein